MPVQCRKANTLVIVAVCVIVAALLGFFVFALLFKYFD